MRYIIALLLLPTLAFTQARHDANWVFGNNVGLSFSQSSVPSQFQVSTFSEEGATSYSDSLGVLQYYYSYELNSNTQVDLRNKSNQIISGGDSIFGSPTANTGGFTIFTNDSIVTTIHLLNVNNSDCPLIYCWQAYETKLRLKPQVEVIYKNKPLLSAFLEEKIDATKHANGRDWWIILRESAIGDTSSCSSRFFKFLYTPKGIEGPFTQTVGPPICAYNGISGSMIFSHDGTILVDLLHTERKVNVFTFDRCNGKLSFRETLDNLSGRLPYDAEFSPNNNLLYVSGNTPNIGSGGNLFQFVIDSANIKSTKRIIADLTNSFMGITGIELAPDGKIYLSINGDAQSLSSIDNPNFVGPASNFSFSSLQLNLGTDSRGLGLPTFPNYNLGPLSIYQADAGPDTVYICADDADSIKVVYLGDSLPVAGVQYLWQGQGIDGKDSSRVLVAADTFGTYYLALTDTTIQYSCQSRVDTVVVLPFYNCPTLIEPRGENQEPRLYPNPFSGDVSIVMPRPGQLVIYNLAGGLEGKYDVEKGVNTIALNQLQLADGMYIYKVWVHNQLVRTDKLVKIQ